MPEYTPTQKIQREILLQAIAYGDYLPLEKFTPENIDGHYRELVELDIHWDYVSEFRGGKVTTNIESEYSRHYESRSVARQMCDGSWVGWTYWYGGGKHGEPESIEWMEYAYNLKCTEVVRSVVIKEFEKVE